MPRSSPSEGTNLSSDAFTGKVWLPAGPLSPSTGTSWSVVSAGSKGPSMKLVCYCSSVSGIRTLLVNCCTQINRYTQVLEINTICRVHLRSGTFKPQIVYTKPLVGGLIACIVVVRVEPQISTVVHYYFYSTVV